MDTDCKIFKNSIRVNLCPSVVSKLEMQRIFAIAWLTWKAALRFRLFLVIAVLLLAAVVGLPLVIKDDGTARGSRRSLLTYTLSAITALLGLSTLWLACGTLARDIEECQIQVVATKPIARWQIWLGKWLGIVTLNAALLAISGACVLACCNGARRSCRRRNKKFCASRCWWRAVRQGKNQRRGH
jgi:ABC-type transport system involved in multi-copper enzyme maturation permease subunit